MFDRIRDKGEYDTPKRQKGKKLEIQDHEKDFSYPTGSPFPADDSIERSIWGETERKKIHEEKHTRDND